MPILDPPRTWSDLAEGHRAKAPRTLAAALRRGVLRPLVGLAMAIVAFGLTQGLLHVTTGGGTLAVGGSTQQPAQGTFAVETTSPHDVIDQVATLFVDHECARSREDAGPGTRALVSLPGEAPMVVAASVGDAVLSGSRAGVHHAFCP